MNLSKNISLLQNIDTKLDGVESDIQDIKNYDDNISGLTTIMQSDIALLKNEVVDLGITLSTFNERNKTFVNEPIRWPPNNFTFLNAGNYVGNEQIGKYQNTEDTNLYVTNYTFGYLYPNTSMNPAQMYHCNSFTTNIGHYDGSSFEDVNISFNANRLQYDNYVQLGVTNVNDNRLHIWRYDFSDAPICIPPQNYFAQSISGDFSSYGSWSTSGVIQGYRL